MRRHHRRWRIPVVLSALALVLISCEEEESARVVQPLDLQQLEDVEEPFDRNNVLPTESFVDATSLDAEAIDRFLQKTPYERPSFLATYQSNGVRAADAIARAARTYNINPLAFLVFGESLTAIQLAGAALVLGAAVSLNLRTARAEPLPA